MQNERKQPERQQQQPERLSVDAPRDGEAIRTARIHTENLVRRTMDQMAQEQARPRLRAKANAEDAESRVDEAMGYHEPLSPISLLWRAGVAIEEVCNATRSTFASMSTALGNPQMDAVQAVEKVAELGRAAIESQAARIAQARSELTAAQASVYARAQRCFAPPAELAGVVSDARAALRGLTDKERSDLMAHATGHDREVLMYAIGGAPGFVSGAHQVKRTEFRNEILAVRDPELLELEPGIPLMLAALDKTEAGMRRLMGMVVDFPSAEALRKLRG